MDTRRMIKANKDLCEAKKQVEKDETALSITISKREFLKALNNGIYATDACLAKYGRSPIGDQLREIALSWPLVRHALQIIAQRCDLMTEFQSTSERDTLMRILAKIEEDLQNVEWQCDDDDGIIGVSLRFPHTVYMTEIE